jgi:hypothetical protein
MELTMSCKPQVVAWMALLGTCGIHGNVEMATHVVKQICEMKL